MYTLEKFKIKLTDELEIAVTTNLKQSFGIEIVHIDSGDIENTLSTVIELLDQMHYSAPPLTLTRFFNFVYTDNCDRQHLFTDVAKSALIQELLARANLPLDTKVMQYHPPLPSILDRRCLSYFTGYFPLQTQESVEQIPLTDYRRLLH